MSCKGQKWSCSTQRSSLLLSSLRTAALFTAYCCPFADCRCCVELGPFRTRRLAACTVTRRLAAYTVTRRRATYTVTRRLTAYTVTRRLMACTVTRRLAAYTAPFGCASIAPLPPFHHHPESTLYATDHSTPQPQRLNPVAPTPRTLVAAYTNLLLAEGERGGSQKAGREAGRVWSLEAGRHLDRTRALKLSAFLLFG